MGQLFSIIFFSSSNLKENLRNLMSREGRNRTCHSRFYPSATGFEDQLEHQSRPLFMVPGMLAIDCLVPGLLWKE